MARKNEIIWYHPDLVMQARDLRNNSTYSERKLWMELKGNQVRGYDFHRQKPINYYIVDFYCPKLKLAIEIDGAIHESEENCFKDLIRQEKLQEFGISFLRFKDQEVKQNIQRVVSAIYKWIDDFERNNRTHP